MKRNFFRAVVEMTVLAMAASALIGAARIH